VLLLLSVHVPTSLCAAGAAPALMLP
jgi:hypothetical protein